MTAPKEAQRAYTIETAADLKSLSQSTIRAAIKAGRLDAKVIGGRYRISASALEAWWANLEDA